VIAPSCPGRQADQHRNPRRSSTPDHRELRRGGVGSGSHDGWCRTQSAHRQRRRRAGIARVLGRHGSVCVGSGVSQAATGLLRWASRRIPVWGGRSSGRSMLRRSGHVIVIPAARYSGRVSTGWTGDFRRRGSFFGLLDIRSRRWFSDDAGPSWSSGPQFHRRRNPASW
jgi:hypothetical protein